MALIPVEVIDRPGINPAGIAANVGGDTFNNTGREIIFLENGDASPTTATVAVEQQLDGNAVVPLAVTNVPATNGRIMVGPFDKTVYGSSVSITYTSITSLNVSVLRFS